MTASEMQTVEQAWPTLVPHLTPHPPTFAPSTAAPPPAIAERLADIPDAVWSAYCRDPLAPLMRAPATEPGAACAEALGKAHTALHDGAWQEAMRHLDAAAQRQYDHQVTRAIDAALAEQPAFARTVDATIAATIQEVRAALQAGDAERAHALTSAPPESAVVQRRQ